jgi:hypothetical protein
VNAPNTTSTKPYEKETALAAGKKNKAGEIFYHGN